MKTKKILAWHWCKSDMLTQHSNECIADGETLSEKRELGLCNVGLHASLDPFDALQYAPGSIICRVELSGVIIKGDDKLCAEHRKVLWHADAETILHEFACDVAERTLHNAKVTDERSWGAIKAKRRWLKKEITDADLAAAWTAARDAAWATARAAARTAAWTAARAAARATARAAARTAARDAEIAWQRKEFNQRIESLKP